MGTMNSAALSLPSNNNSRPASASAPTVTTVGKATTYRNLKGRDSRRFGNAYAGEVAVGNHAHVVTGESITLWGVQTRRTCGLHAYRIAFKVGDRAVYDSWNLVFTGTIVAIGAKTVTIENWGKRHRLSIFEFSRRNWNFDAEEIDRRNSEWRD